MTSAVLKNAFTILMNDDLTPNAILTNENEVGLFKKLEIDGTLYKYCDYCVVELGTTLEFLYRILWDITNRVYMIAVYKITDKSSELISHIKCEDLEIRFMMSKSYTEKKQKESQDEMNPPFIPINNQVNTANVSLDDDEKKEVLELID